MIINIQCLTGREYDWQTGGYHYRARSYDAALGRFLQRDPAGMADGSNMYLYCGNDPVNGRDPSGRWIDETNTPDWWCPKVIDPRTREPVPDGMYIDWDTGEYRECPPYFPSSVDPFLPGVGRVLVTTYEFSVYWLGRLLKSLMGTNPFEGHDYRTPVPYGGGGGPNDHWDYIGNIGARMKLYHW
jgi:RHS repeat-associated protein